MKHKGSYSVRVTVPDINAPTRAGVAFTLINILSKLAALLFTPIFTRIFSKEGYGEYSLFVSLLSVTVVLCSLEMSGGVIMRVLQKERRVASLCLLSAYAAVVALCCVIVPAVAFIARKYGILLFPYSALILFVCVASEAIIGLYLSYARFLYRWQPVALSAFASSIAAPILGIALIRLSAPDMHVTARLGAASGILAAVAVAFVILTVRAAGRELCVLGIRLPSAVKKAVYLLRLLLLLAIPMLPYYAAVMAISQSGRLFLAHGYSNAAVAEYSVAHTLGIAPSSVFSGISAALSPWVMRKVRAENISALRRVVNLCLTVYSLLIICYLTVSDILLSFIAPPEYSRALPIAFITAASTVPLSLTQTMTSISLAKEHTRATSACGIAIGVAAVILSWLFVPRLGALFAAAVSAAGFLLLAVCGTVAASRAVGKSLIGVPYALFLPCLVIIGALVIYALGAYAAARYAILLISLTVTGVVLYKNRSLLSEGKI